MDGIPKLSFLKVECVSIFRCFIEGDSVFIEDDLRFFAVGVSMDGRRWRLAAAGDGSGGARQRVTIFLYLYISTFRMLKSTTRFFLPLFVYVTIYIF